VLGSQSSSSNDHVALRPIRHVSPWSQSSDQFWAACLQGSDGSVRHMACGTLKVKVRARSTCVTSLAALVHPPIARFKDR
jgi:hypothetical protein